MDEKGYGETPCLPANFLATLLEPFLKRAAAPRPLPHCCPAVPAAESSHRATPDSDACSAGSSPVRCVRQALEPRARELRAWPGASRTCVAGCGRRLALRPLGRVANTRPGAPCRVSGVPSSLHRTRRLRRCRCWRSAVATRSVIPTKRMRPFFGAMSSPHQSECRIFDFERE